MMNLDEMSIEQIDERLASLEVEVREMQTVEDVTKATEEKKSLLERKKELVDFEARNNAVKELVDNKPVSKVVVTERKGDSKMENLEIRNSKEYVDAFAEYVKSGDATELRALMTENVSGTIAIPDLVLNEVKTAWDKEEVMSLVKKVNLKGNLKVNFEISGTDAVVHTEGGEAVTEEELVEGIATLIPAYIKKWISITDEVMSMRGAEFLTYIYNELAHKIAKKCADLLVAKIVALPTVATSTSPSADKITEAPAMATVASAIGHLSDEASNPTIIMNKLTWAEFKRVQYANGYGVDPFEGLRVVFNNTLPSYASAGSGAVYMIVGDLGYGALANLPNGEGIEFKFDEYSRKKEDLVEVLGKEYIALGVVSCGAFVNVAKA